MKKTQCSGKLRFVPAILLVSGNVLFTHAAHDPAGIEFFEQKIRPIFVENCYKCHSEQSGKNKGGLRLDTRDSVLKGGDSGPALIPGDPEKSPLIKAVRYTDKDLQMPPKGKKLSAEQISDLEHWVRLGAPDPRDSQIANQKSQIANPKTHWAFQPVRNPPVPEVKNKRWAKTPVDHFILQKLEAKNLKPSPPADKRTLIRRATFDLTGLPPTAEEVEAFEKDHSQDAFAKVVDRLLASPRYGERWGRHWLDIARYADTKGYLAGNEERRFPYSYTYRDWVIRALNEDLPYDKFLMQQIAADQLDLGDDKRPLAALGFLTLGRRFLNNIHDIIDDRIDVVCRGTMALTVGCARCHDHKYDPIPTKDYYSLYGVFASSHEPQDKPLLGIDAPKQLHEEYEKEKQRREDALNNYREDRIAAVTAALRQKTGDYLLAALDTQKLTDKSQSETLARERKLDPWIVQRWVDSLAKWAKETNSIFAPWTIFAEVPEKDFAEKAKDLATKVSADKSVHPLVSKMFAGDPPKSMKEVADRYGKLFTETEKTWRDLLAKHAKEKLAPPTVLPDAMHEQLRQILYADGMPYCVSKDEATRLFDVPTIEQVRELRRQIAELDAIHPGAPPRAMALVDKDTPETPHVFVRGNAGNWGPEVPRQMLLVVAGEDRKPFQKGSGRLELAQAITSTNNPLTARVIVNRVWLHHFGKGFVATPSDFGIRSESPTHPELLDWLAWNFMHDGWSLKKLHRQIMLSAVYQQSSNENSDAAKIDPSNLLLWKMNRQRLEFEALRDSLLAVSGKLDLTMAGLSVDLFAEPFSPRRSIYGFIDRQNLPGVLRTFDFANPDTTSSQRYFTTVPQQALFLLNSPFVVEQARLLVTNADFSALPREKDKITFIYQRLFQREPDKDEMKLGEQFLKKQVSLSSPPVNQSAWQYGYGKFNSMTRRVTEFNPFPHFTGKRWQNSPAFPDPQLAYTMLDIEGGHPGNRPEHSVIRRWTSPFEGTVRIEGTLTHNFDKGDGVRGRAVSSRHGELGIWTAFNTQKETLVKKAEVRRGDTIDFIVDMRDGPAHDTFKWAPVIKVVEVRYGTPPPQKMDWNATRDFDGPPKDLRPLTAWEKYVQTLLLSNEFVFVD